MKTENLPVKILDSWALMAWLQDEESAAVVERELQAAQDGKQILLLSAINAAEVYYLLAKRYAIEKAVEWRNTILPALPVRLEVPTAAEIFEAASLKAKYPISYADAFAVRLSLQTTAPLITGDPEMRSVNSLRLQWIGPASA